MHSPEFAKGFSLVELMIATAIGLFLMSAIVQVFSQSRSTVSINQSVNEIQDRGRTLLHHLGANIRQRGYQGCLPPLALTVDDVDDIDWANSEVVTPLANVLPNIPYSRSALRGFEVSGSGAFSPTPTNADMQSLENGVDGLKPRPYSDVLHVEYGDRRSVELFADMATELAAIEINGNPLGFAVGDLVMVGDCSAADIFQITNITTVGATTRIEHAATSNRNARLSKPYETSARLRRFRYFTYFVADTGRDTRSSVDVYSLYRMDHNEDIVELADGIDFLQVSYKNQTALGVQDLTANAPAFDPMRVIGLDIGVLIVGLKDVLSSDDAKVYRLPGAAIGPGNDATYSTSKLLKTPFRSYIDIKNRS